VWEHWNGANGFIFYGKTVKLLPIAWMSKSCAVITPVANLLSVYQHVDDSESVVEKQWFERMQSEDLRALTPLIWSHVNPYGISSVDMRTVTA